MDRPPRIMAIHDLCGVGRCSLSVIIPVLSVMGAQCCALPTAYLSAPSNAEGFTFRDLSDELSAVLDHWKAMDIRFDMIYSGYLASPEQADAVLMAKEYFPECRLLVDPVMGDQGRLYKRIGGAMQRAMQRLCAHAELIFPNSTEAACLLGKAPDSVPADEEEAALWLRAPAKTGCSVVLTGLRMTEGRVYAAWHDAAGGRMGLVSEPYIQREYHGTGDLFAAVVTGALARGEDLEAAAVRAARFVHDCAALTCEQDASSREGLLFEPLLRSLC